MVEEKIQEIATASVNEKIWEFLLSGGVFMAFIVVCSVVAVSVSIHRIMTLRWNSIVPPFLQDEWNRLERYFTHGKASEVRQALRQSDTPIGIVGRVAMSGEFRSQGDASEAVEAAAKEQFVKLENGMGVLEVVITIAPLLGLLGTVSGLVSVFATLGNSGDVADPILIAAGIAKALNTTIAGLVVAVITVIFHSCFTRKLERISARLEVMISHLLHLFYKYGGPSLYEKEAEAEKKNRRPPAEVVVAIEKTGSDIDSGDLLK